MVIVPVLPAPADALRPFRSMIPANRHAVGGWVAALIAARFALGFAALRFA